MSDLSIILFLHHVANIQTSSIFKRKNSEMYSESLEKDDKKTSQVVCFIHLEHF